MVTLPHFVLLDVSFHDMTELNHCDQWLVKKGKPQAQFLGHRLSDDLVDWN